MDGGTACVILKNRFILKEIYDEAPTNEGSDVDKAPINLFLHKYVHLYPELVS